MSMRNVLSCVIVVILAAPPNGLGQNVSGAWTTVTALQPLQKLIVELKSGKTVKGEFSSASDSGLTLIRGNKMENVDRAEIRKISQDGGTSATKSTLIGTAVGGGGGAVLGAAAGGCNPRSFVCFTRAETAGATALVGASVGAITGFVIGKVRHKKTLLYEVR
jgi:hypothetical protein